MKRNTYKARDGKDLSIVFWDSVSAPVAVVQILHGMAEHVERYDDFAKALNSAGFIVFGIDQRGHGYTDKDRLGLVEEDRNIFEETVSDAMELTAYAKVKYRLPVIIFGHSYGSFVLQRYLSYTSSQIHGAILSGSALIEGGSVNLACSITNGSLKPKKCDKPGSVFVKHTFDKYDKSYKGETKGAWLTRDTAEREKFQNDALCGFTCSMGFYHYLFRGFKALKLSRHLKLRKDLPVLLLGGSDDKLSENGKLLLKLEEKYKKFGLAPTVRLYKDARHLILNEINKAEVYEDVINFINSCLPQ